MEIAKALILAGTPSNRPWPGFWSGPPQLVPVANRPVLFHNLEALRRAGILEATIALDAASAVPIMAAVGQGADWSMDIRYTEWTPARGLGAALAAAQDHLAGEPVLVGPGDALHREHIHPHIASFADERLDAMALRLTGNQLDGRGRALTGGYLLSERAVSMLLEGPASTDDPVEGIRRRGGLVRVQAIDGCLPCHGGQDALLDANRRMLEALRGTVDESRYPSCRFQGPVVVDASARLEDTLVRGPAVIGPHARLTHAYVGPYTSVGPEARVDGTEVEYSILLEGADLRHLGTRVEASVIGRGARIRRSFEMPAALRLSIGEGAEITLS